MKHKILLGGRTNVGKTLQLIQLAVAFPDKQVHIYDCENEVANTMEEFGLTLPNLTIINVTPDWPSLDQAFQMSREGLNAGDWLGIDMMGVLWDLAQNYYSKAVYGESPAQHIITLKEQAKKTDFGGFDGLTEWPVIKRMHNDDFVDAAVRWSPFNVMATTSMADYSPKAKVPETDVEGMMAKEFGQKLEGEKHNYFRFRTIAVLYRDLKTGKYYYKVVKEKGKEVPLPLEAIDITGGSFIESYLARR